jgi:hypothetical protein
VTKGVGGSKKKLQRTFRLLLFSCYPLLPSHYPLPFHDSRCGLAPQASWFIPRSAAAILPRPDLPCTCLEPM